LAEAEKREAQEGRLKLMEALCEVDEQFLEAYLSGDKRCDDVSFVNSAIRRATIALKAVPCMVGAAFRNKGVQCVMDAIVTYLPSPVDVSRVPVATHVGSGKEVQLPASDKGEAVCLAWKVVHDHRMGLVTYVRVISGVLRAGVMVLNTSSPAGTAKERLNKLVLLKAEDMEQVSQLTAGNIGAAIGLKNVATGDTLMEGTTKSPMVLQRVTIPPPVFFRSIEPQSLAEQDKLDASLALLHREDPSFQISVNKDTGQTLVGGMGELHLEYILDRLKTHYKVNGVVGNIMIAYRCAPETAVEEEVDLTHTYDAGNGKIMAVRIKMTVSSGELEDALKHLRVEDGRSVKWVGDNPLKSRELLAFEAITEGFHAACNRVNSKGHPLVNVFAEVSQFQVEGDTSLNDALSVFKACAERAVRTVWDSDEGLIVLEPAMTVQVRVESESLGAVSADLTSARRGVIGEVRVEGRERALTATVPLKEMIGYSPAFRQKTAGKGSYTMEFQQFIVATGPR
jgi:elongation factor G